MAAYNEPGRRALAERPRTLVTVFGVLTVVGVLLGGPGRAAAQRIGIRSGPPPANVYGKHCLGDQEQKLLLEHYVVGSINPLGLENQLRLSVCTPLLEKPGLLYDFTNFEFGLANYVSPTHVHGGLFGAVTPLSFITLKAEVTGFYIWPIGLTFPGAGVTPLLDQDTCTATYDDNVPPKDPVPGAPPQPQATNGYGVRALLGAALQGSVPFGKRLDLLLFNGFNSEFWRYNTDKCIFVARRDVGIRGSGAWILANTSVLAFAIKVHPNHTIRIGATNDLVYTPDNGYLGNVAAGLISYGVSNLRNLAKSFAVFVRAGTFTHGFRHIGPNPINHANAIQPPGAVTLAIGLDITYELAKRKTRRANEKDLQAVPPAPPAAPETPGQAPGPAPGQTPALGEPPGPVPTGSPQNPSTPAEPTPTGEAR